MLSVGKTRQAGQQLNEESGRVWVSGIAKEASVGGQVEPRTWFWRSRAQHHLVHQWGKLTTSILSQRAGLQGALTALPSIFLSAIFRVEGQLEIRRIRNGLWEAKCSGMMESLEKEYRLKIPEKWNKAWWLVNFTSKSRWLYSRGVKQKNVKVWDEWMDKSRCSCSRF